MPDGCVDLIYIDPPFNSNRNYEVFWNEKREMRSFDDRHASTRAYIDFMRPRCGELVRVLKSTGTFYYHCDWHASHYVKVMLDEILGEHNFVNEIIWKRQSSHNDAKQGSKHLGRVHDTIFMYGKSEERFFKHLYRPYDPEYVQQFYRHTDKPTGRRYRLDNLTAPGGAAPSKGNPSYEFLGITRYWRYSREKMESLYREGRIVQTRENGVPAYKRYLDEGKGVPLGTVWDDIGPVQGIRGGERIGYPTQKPLRLLERIIEISSQPNDIVLDAFCGCGTAIVAAQNAGRQWIGMDISPTACRVMAKRVRDACGLTQNERLWRAGRGFVVRDLPRTEAELRKLPHFEFENWAVIAIGGVPNRKRGADMGIDGKVYPMSALPSGRVQSDHLALVEEWYPVQVKQRDRVGRPEIDLFEAAMIREDRRRGYFVAFDYTSDAVKEIERFRSHHGKEIIAYTVRQLLELEGEEQAQRIPPSKTGSLFDESKKYA